MIKTGEKVHIEGIHLTEGQLETIRHMPQVFSTVYEEGNLTLRFEETGRPSAESSSLYGGGASYLRQMFFRTAYFK